ncbi:hypothetical protein [Spiroplasma citri]|nr:hypothetical protein [Spiroplasma citri]
MGLFTFLGIFVKERNKTKRQKFKLKHQTFIELFKNQTLDKTTIQLMAQNILFFREKNEKIKETEEFFEKIKKIFEMLETKNIIDKIAELINHLEESKQIDVNRKDNRNEEIGYEQKNDEKKIKDEKNEILFKFYLDKLNKLEEIENKSKLNIINNFSVIELLSISFTTAVLLLKNKIKSEQVKEYLKSAFHFYNNNLEINPNTAKLLVEMSAEEEKKFSDLLKEENDIVNKYVIRLNNVFLVKYENDSWERFDSLYNIEKQYFNSHKKVQKLNQKLEKVFKFNY